MSQCALVQSPMKYTASMMQISVGVRMFIILFTFKTDKNTYMYLVRTKVTM